MINSPTTTKIDSFLVCSMSNCCFFVPTDTRFSQIGSMILHCLLLRKGKAHIVFPCDLNCSLLPRRKRKPQTQKKIIYGHMSHITANRDWVTSCCAYFGGMSMQPQFSSSSSKKINASSHTEKKKIYSDFITLHQNQILSHGCFIPHINVS